MLGIVLALLDEAFCHLTRQHRNVCYRYCHNSFLLLILGTKIRKVLELLCDSPTFFIILRQNAGEDAPFLHPRQPVLSVITSIRREAVAALQVVDALHVVGGQREVEDVVVLGKPENRVPRVKVST